MIFCVQRQIVIVARRDRRDAERLADLPACARHHQVGAVPQVGVQSFGAVIAFADVAGQLADDPSDQAAHLPVVIHD